jgi:protein SCO1/2
MVTSTWPGNSCIRVVGQVAVRRFGETWIGESTLKHLRFVLWVFAASSLLAVAAFAGWRAWRGDPTPTIAQNAESLIRTEFDLLDHTGKRVSSSSYEDRWLLIFFGYTFCPDVCPTTLGEVSLLMDALGEKADRIQPLFVTIDPERDTPEVLADYVAAFHPRIVGLTGSTEEIAAAASNYRVYYAKVSEEGAPDSYLMDHSAYLYLIDPAGNFVRPFPFGSPMAETKATITSLITAN